MKHKATAIIILTLIFICSSEAEAQNKYQKKSIQVTWRDGRGDAWSDLDCQMAIRIDPQYAATLNASEISSDDNPPLAYAIGEWHYFSLKNDGARTYAEPDVLVYADKADPVTYQIELQKDKKSLPFTQGSTSKLDVSNDSPNLDVGVEQVNTPQLRDWLIVAGAILVGAILLYVIVFRWLFSGLLFNRRWAVSKAEHFTWSLSLILLLALGAVMTLFYKPFGPRLETWLIIGVLGAFWFLHAIVWMVSGKEQSV